MMFVADLVFAQGGRAWELPAELLTCCLLTPPPVSAIRPHAPARPLLSKHETTAKIYLPAFASPM